MSTREKVIKLSSIIAMVIVLAACGQSADTVVKGNIKLLSITPDVTGCVIRVGDWFGVQAENLGNASDWENGSNTATFTDGVVATDMELVDQGDGSSILFIRIPVGAMTGKLIINAGSSGSVEINVEIQASSSNSIIHPQLAVNVCVSNPPVPD